MKGLFKKKPRCPYCGEILDPAPKRKKKCPHCAQYILVRKGELLTEEEAKIRDWLGFLEQFSISRKDFDKHRAGLTKRFGSQASVNDTVWGILNALVSKTKDIHTLQNVYFEMERLASQEGKDPKPYVAERLKIELLVLQREGVKTVRIVGCGYRTDDPSGCSAGKALWGKRFATEVALNQMPIPTACQRPDGCRCAYVSESRWKQLHQA